MDRAVEISISGEFVYTAYKPSDPFTVAVDFPEVDKGAFAGKITSNRPGISEINVSGTRTPMTTARLEILMDSPAEIEAVKTDGSLLIRMKEEETSLMAAAMREEAVTRRQTEPSPEIASAVEETEEILSPAMRITGVEFDYSDGTLKLVIQGDGAMTADVYALDDRIVVDVPDVVMAASMPAAVVAPVKSVRYGYHNGAVRMVIALPSEAVLEILTAEKPPEEAVPEEAAPAVPEVEVEEEEVKKYTGKIISLDFQNADIVPIFRFIGDISGYNVVVHPSVSGTVTLKLLNVPWDQALDIVLNTYGLAKQIEGNIMTIAPTSVFDKIAKEQAQHKKTKEVTAELVLRTIHLNHIDVNDMKKEIDDRKVLSPRGTLTVDTTGNDLWVEDTEEVLDKVGKLVRHFDKAMYGKQQIMVEAKIVTVSDNVFRSLGVNWSGNYGVSLFGTPVTGTFSVNPPSGLIGAVIPNALAGSVITGSAPYAQLSLTLDALETVGDSKTLANPRVLTINGQSASIQQGTQIPVSTTTAEGSTTEFINANLSLNVTPTIKPNDVIEIQLQVNKDRPTQIGGQTGIDTNSVTTKALIKNGETLVIGGIYTNEVEHSADGIPVLRSIPILGWLFGSKTDREATSELMILITPRIIKD
jgi:type IV pilus secretin PilQ/predicted competence protein